MRKSLRRSVTRKWHGVRFSAFVVWCLLEEAWSEIRLRRHKSNG